MSKKAASEYPWFKFYPEDWIGGTKDLQLEDRGIYVGCVALLYQHDGLIPDNDKFYAYHLNISIRKWRACRDRLIAAGKLIAVAAGYTNERVKRELAARHQAAKHRAAADRENDLTDAQSELDLGTDAAIKNSQIDAASGAVKSPAERGSNSVQRWPNFENSKSPNENNGGDDKIEREDREEGDKKNFIFIVPTKIAARDARDDDQKISRLDLLRRLTGAAGGAAPRPSQRRGDGLETPLGWLADGCDLERDVLPTLAVVSARTHGQSVASWAYFSREVMASRDRRLSGAPPPSPRRFKTPIDRRREHSIAEYNRFMATLGFESGSHP